MSVSQQLLSNQPHRLFKTTFFHVFPDFGQYLSGLEQPMNLIGCSKSNH